MGLRRAARYFKSLLDVFLKTRRLAVQIADASALVTGGASGLGEAVVRLLHAREAKVVIADVDTQRGSALAGELGEGATFLEVDVTDADAVAAAAATAGREPGGLRISVHCAGIFLSRKLLSRDGAHPTVSFEDVVRVNLVGTFNALRGAVAAMSVNAPDADDERGVCVNTASVAAFDGQVGQVAYAASKAGIVGMTLPAARDLASLGIRVCSIAPGPFQTPFLGELPDEALAHVVSQAQFPKRLGRAGEYAALVCHVVENQMLNGETIRLDGAMRMPPR